MPRIWNLTPSSWKDEVLDLKIKRMGSIGAKSREKRKCQDTEEKDVKAQG